MWHGECRAGAQPGARPELPVLASHLTGPSAACVSMAAQKRLAHICCPDLLGVRYPPQGSWHHKQSVSPCGMKLNLHELITAEMLPGNPVPCRGLCQALSPPPWGLLARGSAGLWVWLAAAGRCLWSAAQAPPVLLCLLASRRLWSIWQEWGLPGLRVCWPRSPPLARVIGSANSRGCLGLFSPWTCISLNLPGQGL